MSPQASKLAHSACLDALKVLSLYLQRELGVMLAVGNDENVLTILLRAQEYCQRLDVMTSHPETIILLLSCWKAVYKYVSIGYTHHWRMFQQQKHHYDMTQESTTTLETTIRYAEDCSTCQRHVLLLQRNFAVGHH